MNLNWIKTAETITGLALTSKSCKMHFSVNFESIFRQCWNMLIWQGAVTPLASGVQGHPLVCDSFPCSSLCLVKLFISLTTSVMNDFFC